MRDALGRADRRPADGAPGAVAGGVAPGLPRTTHADQLEDVLRSLIEHAGVPIAVIVQGRTSADGRVSVRARPGLHPRPVRAARSWPSGEFRSGDSVMSLDALSRRAPAAGLQLRAVLARVESLHRTVCEVSFTVDAGRLWIDDVWPVRHGRAAAERTRKAGLAATPASAAGPGS